MPPALQGPGWQPRSGRPDPLREVAAQALTEEQPKSTTRPGAQGSCACGGTTALHAPDCPVHPMRLRAVERQATQALPQELRDAGLYFAYHTTPDLCPAEYHRPGYADARCDLPAGHPDYHRDQTAPGGTFRWDDSVAMYPTSSPEDNR